MKKVGITGIMGSGKSTFCRLLSAYSGAPVYDSDRRAKELMIESKRVVDGVTAIFGDKAYRRGELNREWVARKIFADPQLRERLDNVVHTAVAADFERWCTKQKGPYVIIESALLFGSTIEDMVDVKIMIDAPEELCITRAMLRDGAERRSIESRLRNQLTPEEMRHRADRVVLNDDNSLMFPSVIQTDLFIKSMPECR